ncbi:MAG TPA: lytic transglycosylase domain-containing protein [Acidobacteriota bacterium]|nr:lytic transglycosylase domain-containing protein [Acidobacteriota bacterium]
MSLFVLFVCAENTSGETLYRYLDDSGDRVLTNIPPVRASRDMTIIGSPHSPAAQPAAAEPASIDALIEKHARNNQLDPYLIRSIIATESSFNPNAVSPKGARGLMQLMPATAERLGVKNSFDPEENIRGGVEHFRFLMDTFANNLELSLAAYNAGENLVLRLGRIPEIKETKDYVRSVKQRYRQFNLNATRPGEEKPQQLFRYFDEYGVLHLTNIPPLR